jgi:phosphate transport system ATP-binding protein
MVKDKKNFNCCVSEHRAMETAIYNYPEHDTHIKAEQFSICYGDNEAVKKVNVNIPKGKVTAIIGPSGCGKSTFLRAINRMNDLIPVCYAKGKLFYEGLNVYESRVDVVSLRRKIGMVFQKPNPFPKTIYENIIFSPRIHGIKNKNRLNEIVESSLLDAALWEEVKDRLHKNALGLSGGQQQRLCIARAIAAQPEILLMDEPTSALDPMATQKIEELIEKLSKKYTIIIVTHNMAQAARVSDFTAFFYEGVMVEFNKTTDLFKNPLLKRTEDYITGRFG